MGTFRRALVGFALVLGAWLAGPRIAAADELEDEAIAYRKTISEELSKTNPDAAKLLETADADLDAGRTDDAITGYEAAAKLVPESPHPLRRLCSAYSAVGRKDDAIARCRDALAKRDDAIQEVALAFALLSPPRTDASSLEAFRLADKAAGGADGYAYVALCEAALQLDQPSNLEKCTNGLLRVAPHSPATFVYGAIYSTYKGDFDEAKASIAKARSLGGGGKQLDALEAGIDASVPFYVRYARPIETFLMVWAALLCFVVVAGFTLSALTRRAALELPVQRTGHAHGSAKSVRTAYRVVLWLAGLLFYLSLPIMLTSVVVFALGLVYLAFMVGHVPIYLLFAVCSAAFVTVVSTLKSLVSRSKDIDPGERLDLNVHKELRTVLREVADKVETREVDTVFLTPGSEFAVFERGGLVASLRGTKTERCLIVGAGVLEGMQRTHFKAVLAHEYGHFRNEDTAGGGFALAVQRSAMLLIVGMVKGGAARVYNPAWWMVRGFYNLFIRISHGASRLQEILADRWAAFSYGAEAFEGGLRHVVRRGVEFATFADMRIREAVKADQPILNLYQGDIATEVDDATMEGKIEKLLTRASSEYDSHPPPEERFRLVRRLDAPTPKGEQGDALAWDLFEDRAGLEATMTKTLLSRINLPEAPRVRGEAPRKLGVRARAAARKESLNRGDLSE